MSAQSGDSPAQEAPVSCVLYGQLPLGRRVVLRQRQEKARTLNSADSDVWLAATARAARGSPPTLYRRHLPPPASSSQASFRQNCAARANHAGRQVGVRARWAVLLRRLWQGHYRPARISVRSTPPV
ncbi:uncharacterized protein TRAVEDRAFT_73943 [Trametes versicolor FP-101664 SS1]|uniref:uncharacterized protein n=1 Tax=Trametes versicolor (strain FP-101664) TaxID=717944 RepID=UPI00046236C0|nr:uncharacterized protein TRAVEDRAFT_73943 [Trametes versicolor FP-101664 SS1]EIW54855.1 hypothetical protein TRAVEDRAFT_73943 [Trametes versicolor FP-101664 SS1]